MLGEIQWLTFKSKRQRDKEDAEYLKWAFPFGNEQREKITSILQELFPKDDPAESLVAYLTCKEIYLDIFETEPEYFSAIKAIKKALFRYRRIISEKDLPLQLALITVDSKVGPELDYPPAENIRELARAEFM